MTRIHSMKTNKTRIHMFFSKLENEFDLMNDFGFFDLRFLV